MVGFPGERVWDLQTVFQDERFGHCPMNHTVVALGGGTVRYEWNRDILKGSGPIILLTAKLKVLAERVKKNDRPRVNPGATLEQDLSQLWKRFKHLYYLAADFTYRTDRDETVRHEANDIIRILKQKVPGF